MWHSVHACVVGMWFAGFAVATLNDVVVWQDAQSPVAGCAGSWTGVGRVTIATPKKLFPVSWQVAQAMAPTGAWFIGVPAKLAKLVAAWQLSHAMPGTGMCVGGASFGTRLVANESPAPWQVEHPPVMPWWFMAAIV